MKTRQDAGRSGIVCNAAERLLDVVFQGKKFLHYYDTVDRYCMSEFLIACCEQGNRRELLEFIVAVLNDDHGPDQSEYFVTFENAIVRHDRR